MPKVERLELNEMQINQLEGADGEVQAARRAFQLVLNAMLASLGVAKCQVVEIGRDAGSKAGFIKLVRVKAEPAPAPPK